MTIKTAASHLGAGWDLINDIQKRHLQKRFKHIPLGRLKRIAIDEISIGQGVLDRSRSVMVPGYDN